MSTNKSLVIGAGIAGIRTALELAEAEHDVYLLESSPYIGGTLPQLDKQFPSDDCGMCKILPTMGDDCSEFCFRRGAYHKNVELITDADLVGLSGHAGNFKAQIKKNPAYVKADKCIACGDCAAVCEVDVISASDKSASRKAIYIKYPLAYPNVFTIDEKNCSRCGKCVDACPTKAIDLDATDEERELAVGAIVLSMGFNKTYDEIRKEYGYAHYENVVTSNELERALTVANPIDGVAHRLAAQAPKVAFLQCVGSREDERNFCSAACCMIALKEAVMLKERNPNTDVKIFYMDMRAYGKGYHRYLNRAKELGVEFIRSRVSHVEEQPNKDLEIRYTTEDDRSLKERLDVVVLSVGQTPSKKVSELSTVLGIELNDFGFCKTLPFSMVETTKKGILACGSIASPKDIGESVTGGVAAAATASQYLAPESDDEPAARTAPASETAAPRTGVFVCSCGKEVAGSVNVDKIVEAVKSDPGIAFVESVDYLCVKLDEIAARVSESDANRVVFAACAPYHFEKLFAETLEGCGIDSSFFEIVNLREQVSWVHEDKEGATKKATAQLRMAIEKLRIQEGKAETSGTFDKRALVVGGGIAGLTAALTMAENAIQVDLVEKTDTLGGMANEIHYTLGDHDAVAKIKDTVKAVENHASIQVYKNTTVGRVAGSVGRFRVWRHTDGAKQAENYGAVVVATGALESETTEYAFGKHPNILTQHQLEARLAEGEDVPQMVVMIQCVGSREDAKNYCSRVCCSQAIKNANKIKERDPKADVYIINRDIMTYGLNEAFYTKARENGVFFIRYEPDDKPLVRVEDGAVTVSVLDQMLKQKLTISPDLVVLSTGMQPGEENSALANMLHVPLDDDGFFQEANTKFRPVDFLKDGVYVCGTARSPMHVNEAITQANAAAGRVITLLSKENVQAKNVTAEVVERRCSACQVCMDACPYEARVLDTEKRIMGVVTAACQGCGACVMACPNGASRLRGFDAKQVLSMIDVAVA